jgi:ABC-type lipoprotein release transport system permease subunit
MMFLFSRLAAHSPQVLATLLMFSLSAGVLGGVLFYMDSTSSNVLEEMTEDITIDMEVQCTPEFYESATTSIEDIVTIVDEQELITNTEIVAFIEGWDHSFPASRFRKYNYIGVDNSIFEAFPHAIQLQSVESELNDTTCYIEKEWAEYLGLQIGDDYVAEILAPDANYTIQRYNATYTITGTFKTSTFSTRRDSGGNPITSLRMITTQSGLLSDFGNVGLQTSNDVFYSIWTVLDSSFITHSSPSLVESSLSEVKARIEQRTLPYARITEFQILGIVYGYNTWASTMTIISLSFSIPSIVMGVMLLVYNSRLTDDQRRRDTGTLITRGASGWQSFSWIMTSALLTGVIGSIGAVLTGTLAAILSGGVRQLLIFSPENLSSFNLLLEPFSIVIVFTFSFIVGFAISLPSAVNALLMTPDEAHSVVERQSLAGKEMLRPPLMEAVALVVSGLLINPLLSTLGAGGVSPTGFTLFAVLVITMFGVFIVVLSRIISLPTAFVKSKLLGLFRSASQIVGPRIMSRNALLAKRSEALGVMFIGLVFTAGFFSAVSASTGSTHMQELFYFDVGADIVINVDGDLRNVSSDIIDQIEAIEGVNIASPLIQTYSYVQFTQASDVQDPSLVNLSLSIFGIDPESWVQTAFLLPYFSVSGNPFESVPKLAESQSNVISSFKPIEQYSGGIPIFYDSVKVVTLVSGINFSIDCTIVDVMSTDHELRSTNYFPGEPEVGDFLIMNIEYIQAILNTTFVNKIYIDLTENSNYTRVMEDVKSLANFTTDEVESSQAEIDAILDSRTGQSIYGVYTLNTLFSLMYLTAGIMIISVVKTRRLQKQFSIMRALGTSNSSIMSAVFVDAGVSMLLGVLTGTLVGLLLSSLLLQIPLVFLGVTAEIVWSRLPVYLALPLPLLIGILILSFASALATTYFVTKRSLSTNLAEDFRHTE